MDQDLQNLVKEAAAAVEHIADPDLKKVGFDRILQHLLDGDGSTERKKSATKPKRKSTSKSAGGRPPVFGNGAAKDGPKAWLEELIEEGFFDEPRPGAAMVEKLAEHGHHLVYQDLTDQLASLMTERRLRRKKMPVKEGAKRQVWHYSKW